MNYTDYIKIKNLFNIYDFYGKDYKKHNDMWMGRTIRLIIAMCELADEYKFPSSADLKVIIKFVDDNPKALKLKSYINCLPGFDPSLGINQSSATELQHGFITMNIPNVKIEKDKELQDKCDFKLDRKYKLIKSKTGFYLTVDFNDITMTLEKRNEFKENTFMVNGILIDNVEFHELVNIIAYANNVKELTKENTQAAYFFLT